MFIWLTDSEDGHKFMVNMNHVVALVGPKGYECDKRTESVLLLSVRSQNATSTLSLFVLEKLAEIEAKLQDQVIGQLRPKE